MVGVGALGAATPCGVPVLPWLLWPGGKRADAFLGAMLVLVLYAGDSKGSAEWSGYTSEQIGGVHCLGVVKECANRSCYLVRYRSTASEVGAQPGYGRLVVGMDACEKTDAYLPADQRCETVGQRSTLGNL